MLQERNRPTEPPTKPAAAPFFLPTIPGLEGNPVFDTEADADQNIGGRLTLFSVVSCSISHFLLEEDVSLQGLNATPPVRCTCLVCRLLMYEQFLGIQFVISGAVSRGVEGGKEGGSGGGVGSGTVAAGGPPS